MSERSYMSDEEKDMIEATERLSKALTSSVAAHINKADLEGYLDSQGNALFGVEVVAETPSDPRIFRAARITFPWDKVEKSITARELCPRCGYMKQVATTCNCVSSSTKVNWAKE